MNEKLGKLKDTNPIIIALIIGFVVMIIIFAYLSFLVSKDRIFPNIKIQGVDVGYLRQEEAKEKVEEHIQSTYANQSVYLFLGETSWEFSYDYFIEGYDIDNTVKKANNMGKGGNVFTKIYSYFSFKNQDQDIPLLLSLNSNVLEETLDLLCEEIYVQAQDAKIYLENDQIKIIPETIGIDLDKDDTRSAIEEALQSMDNKHIELATIQTTPKITEDTLKNIEEKLAGFSTSFNPGAQGRVENLKVSSDMIDGVVLLPGETFSTYETIGPITESNGYKDAPVIVNGQLEPGIGGGVCQISTTLYNAAIRADLEIVERQHHSIPVSYVPLGQDATIAGDWIDFKFKNNLQEPIYIQMYISGSDVIANIYGKKESNIEKIDLETELIEEVAPNVSNKEDDTKYTDYKKIEKQSKTGYKVNVYKVIYEESGEVKKELLYNDYYRPVDGIIVQGTKEREKTYTQNNNDKSKSQTDEEKQDHNKEENIEEEKVEGEMIEEEKIEEEKIEEEKIEEEKIEENLE